MKKIFYLLLTLSALFACTSDELGDSGFVGRKNEIHLSTRLEPMTRTNKQNLQSTQIVAGQKVGIYIEDASSPMVNACWNVGPYGDLINQGTPIYWKDSEINIYAYHPYMSDDEVSKAIFSVKTDQSTDEAYLNSDLLVALRSASQTNEAVPLTFYHKLSKISFEIVGNNLSQFADAEVYLCGTNISTKFNPKEFHVTVIENKADIKVCNLNPTISSTGSAIIIPQTLASGTKFIKIKTGETSYTYRLPESVEFKGGYSYSYRLIFNPSTASFDVSSSGANDWNSEE